MAGALGTDIRVSLLKRGTQHRSVVVLLQAVPCLITLVNIITGVVLRQLMERLVAMVAESKTARGVAPCLILSRAAGSYLLTAIDNRICFPHLTHRVSMLHSGLLHGLVLLKHSSQLKQVSNSSLCYLHRHRLTLVVVRPRYSKYS